MREATKMAYEKRSRGLGGLGHRRNFYRRSQVLRDQRGRGQGGETGAGGQYHSGRVVLTDVAARQQLDRSFEPDPFYLAKRKR